MATARMPSYHPAIREWYLLEGELHQGPYLAAEIIQKAHAGLITPSHQVWLDGSPHWQDLRTAYPIMYRRYGPSALPSAKKNWLQQLQNSAVTEETPPPLPPLKVKNKDLAPPPMPVFKRKEEKIELRENTAIYQQPSKLLNWKDQLKIRLLSVINASVQPSKMIITLSFLLIFLLTLFYFYHFWGFHPKPSDMPRHDYERLKKAFQTSPDDSIQVAFAASPDGSKIWMSSNVYLEGNMSISLQSLPGKVLSEKKIEMSAEAPFERGLSEFVRFNLLSGKGHSSGHYQVKVSSFEEREPTSIMTSLLSKLKKIQYPNPKLQHSEILFWGKEGVDEVTFKEKMSKQKGLIKNKMLGEYEELIQFYTTLNENIRLFLGLMDEKKWQAKYHATIGPIHSNLLVEIDRLNTQYAYNKNPLAKSFEHVKNAFLKFGHLVADTGQSNSPKEKIKSDLNQLLRYGEGQIQSLEAKINLVGSQSSK